MTKSELISEVAAKTQSTKKDAESAVNAVFEVITNTLASNEKIVIAGFGTFEVKERAARKGINPRTKEEITIAASKSPGFKSGKALKDAVNH